MSDRQQVRDLSQQEDHQLRAAMAAFCQLVEELGIDPEAQELDTPELADMLAANWRGQPVAERFELETMSTILGAAVGDYLKHHFELEWRAVTDEFGTAVVLYGGGDRGAQQDWVVAIFDSIEKRLESSEGDFVSEFLDQLWEHLAPLQRGPSSG